MNVKINDTLIGNTEDFHIFMSMYIMLDRV